MGASKFKAIAGALFGAMAVATAGAAEAPSQSGPIFGEVRVTQAEAPKPSQECLSLREMAKEGMIVDDDVVLSGGEIELRLALSAPPAMAPNAAAAGIWIACLLAKSEDQSWPTSVSMLAAPSRPFASTLPVKPSVTTTSATPPCGTSRPSTLPT